MIYVTHDQTEAMTMGDRICVMKDGEIQQVAEPLELFRRPATTYVAGFIGSPPMNLFRGRIETREGRAHFIEQPAPGAGARPRIAVALSAALAEAPGAQPGVDVFFGIRPADLAPAPEAGTASITAQVELVEPMGAETFVHLRSAGHAFIARFPALEQPPLGKMVRVGLALDQAHLFSAESGRALTA
jgi:multiple sugar transport system ATP-binding protein